MTLPSAPTDDTPQRPCSVCGYPPGTREFALPSDVIGRQMTVTKRDIRRILSRLWRAVDSDVSEDLLWAGSDTWCVELARHVELDGRLRDLVHDVVDETFDGMKRAMLYDPGFDQTLAHNDPGGRR